MTSMHDQRVRRVDRPRMAALVVLLALLLADRAGARQGALDQVDDFTYQLQGKKGKPLDLAPIAASAFDLCIVDYSRDGSDEFSPAEIAALRGVSEPQRVRLAYLSIGEAEDYRFYFEHLDPALLAGANPKWKGNFRVRYWEPAWKELIIFGNAAIGKSYLDRILDQGFDGVYLDIVDAFEFFGPKEAGGKNVKRDAAREMVRFIGEIATHARVTRGHRDFLIVPQNGANIIEADWYPADTLGPGDAPTPAQMAQAMQAELFATVDAIGVEDVFFFGKKKNDNAQHKQKPILKILEQWRAADLPVLSVEYLSKPKKIAAHYADLAPQHGFIPYATRRNLAQATINAGFEPD